MSEPAFPEGFMWGTATAAHQVEGANLNSDWWAWEHRPGTPCAEPSGMAIDHFHRYPDDVRLLAELGFDTYRFSVEWARVEPSDGVIDAAALDHYRAMTETVAEAGLRPMVTLNHFTLPAWVADLGGWLSPETPGRLARYSAAVVDALGDAVDWYCTINEPGIVAFGGYLGALGFPPGTTGMDTWNQAIEGLVAGHRLARLAVKERRPEAKVGATHSLAEWESAEGGRRAVEFLRRQNEEAFLEACHDDDFIGVQTYTRVRVDSLANLGPAVRVVFGNRILRNLIVPRYIRYQTSDVERAVGSNVRTTDMGYEYRPQAVAATVRRVADLFPGKDILVTEHGIATEDDAERIEFIRDGLTALHGVIEEGIPLRGYLHWSAFDNFEWAHGYAMRFGLIAVDRSTMERMVKPSARFLGDIARTGVVPTTP